MVTRYVEQDDPTRDRPMGPLNLVNWRKVNAGFCSAMWLLAFLLALVVFAHGMSASSAAVHTTLRHPPPRILH